MLKDDSKYIDKEIQSIAKFWNIAYLCLYEEKDK